MASGSSTISRGSLRTILLQPDNSIRPAALALLAPVLSVVAACIPLIPESDSGSSCDNDLWLLIRRTSPKAIWGQGCSEVYTIFGQRTFPDFPATRPLGREECAYG